MKDNEMGRVCCKHAGRETHIILDFMRKSAGKKHLKDLDRWENSMKKKIPRNIMGWRRLDTVAWERDR